MQKYARFTAEGIFMYTLIEGIHEIYATDVAITDETQYEIINNTDGVWMLEVDGNITKHPFPPPTSEQIVERNTSIRDQFKLEASQAMAPVLVSLQLGDATGDEIVIAKQWQEYYRGLTQVDLSVPEPNWPVKPQ